MNQILSLLQSRLLHSICGLAAIASIVWYLGPLFSFAGFEPFRSATQRLIFIGISLLLWLLVKAWKNYRSKEKSKHFAEAITENTDASQISSEQLSQEEVQDLKERMKEALEILKKTKLGGASGRQSLYQLPWYIIIGPPAAGKTSLLINSDLHFPLADRFGDKAVRGVGGTRNCDWWFTENAVLLDTAGRYTSQDSQKEVDQSTWIGFLSLLKKYRRRKPINGALIVISIADLLEWTEEQRKNHSSNIRKRIYDLHENLGIRFPIYLIFTKCDLLAGFMEFFDGMDNSSRSQVWGMTFPLKESEETNPIDTFEYEFDLLQKQIQDRLIKTLENERSANKRNLIYTFPQQLAILKQKASKICIDIFMPTRYQQTAMIRGVYFTSATQEGTPIDRILGNIANNFRLDRHHLTSTLNKGKSFFINRLLNDVIFAESGLAGTNIRYEKNRVWLQRGTFFVILGITLLCSILWWFSYNQNKKFVTDVNNQTLELETMVAELNLNQNDISSTLPLLNKANSLTTNYFEPSLLMGLGLFQGDKLGEAGNSAYASLLREPFLNRIMTRFEYQIESNLLNEHHLYNALKTYLMLGDRIHYLNSSVIAWVKSDWDNTLAKKLSVEQLSSLESHLQNLFKEQPRLPRPLNTKLIIQAQRTLAQLPLASRAYELLKDELSQKQISQFKVSDASGHDGPLVFVRASGSPLNEGLPGLYTSSGFYNYVIPESSNLVKKLLKERWVLRNTDQSSSEINSKTLQIEVLKLYFDEFIRHWQALLNDIRIIPFSNLVQASEKLNILSGNTSPLMNLLTAIEKETNLNKIPSAKEKVKHASEIESNLSKDNSLIVTSKALQPSLYTFTNHFQKLNRLVQKNDNSQAPIEDTLSLLNELYIFLNAMTNASGKELTLEHQKQISSVIQKVKSSATRQPFPINEMLNSIANNSSSLLNGGICQHLNSTWKSDVLAFCQAAINNKYPISKNSIQKITSEDFGLFFGPNGKMDTFFKTYLDDSVDKSRSPWRSINTNNSPNCISRSSLAQFKLADTIKKVYFSYGGPLPSFGFSVRPVSMSTSIIQINLDIDGQKLNYAHGPVQVKPMKWPGPNQSEQVSLQILPALPGASSISRISSDGPWALFRLLNKGEIIKTGNSNQFIVKFNIQGREVTLELRANSAINPFNLKEIADFRCPTHL